MLGGHASNQFIMLLETPGAEPFMEGVGRVSRTHRQIDGPCGHGQQSANQDFQKEAHR